MQVERRSFDLKLQVREAEQGHIAGRQAEPIEGLYEAGCWVGLARHGRGLRPRTIASCPTAEARTKPGAYRPATSAAASSAPVGARSRAPGSRPRVRSRAIRLDYNPDHTQIAYVRPV